MKVNILCSTGNHREQHSAAELLTLHEDSSGTLKLLDDSQYKAINSIFFFGKPYLQKML